MHDSYLYLLSLHLWAPTDIHHPTVRNKYSELPLPSFHTKNGVISVITDSCYIKRCLPQQLPDVHRCSLRNMNGNPSAQQLFSMNKAIHQQLWRRKFPTPSRFNGIQRTISTAELCNCVSSPHHARHKAWHKGALHHLAIQLQSTREFWSTPECLPCCVFCCVAGVSYTQRDLT
jgi:hypothetical protein